MAVGSGDAKHNLGEFLLGFLWAGMELLLPVFYRGLDLQSRELLPLGVDQRHWNLVPDRGVDLVLDFLLPLALRDIAIGVRGLIIRNLIEYVHNCV